MSLSKQDLLDLLNKAQELLDTVINEYPDDNEVDDMDSPLSFLNCTARLEHNRKSALDSNNDFATIM